jgi:hypothetical protein
MKKSIKLLSVFAAAVLLVPGCGKNVGTPISRENLKEWGLGKTETRYVCNDRDYEWYIDQFDTGIYGSKNCGPACCIMAAKWYNKDFSETVEQAREYCDLGGSGWPYPTIQNYLKQIEIPFSIVKFVDVSKMKVDITEGRILLVPLNMKYISAALKPEDRVNKYGSASTHYIIIKGYRVVDGKTYFEVYDPVSMGSTFQNGTPRGKDRYFLADEVNMAITKYIDSYIAISAPGEPNTFSNLKLSISAIRLDRKKPCSIYVGFWSPLVCNSYFSNSGAPIVRNGTKRITPRV